MTADNTPHMHSLGYLPFETILARAKRRKKTLADLLKQMGFGGAVPGLSEDEVIEKCLLRAAHLKEENEKYKKLSPEDVIIYELYEFPPPVLPEKEWLYIFGNTMEEANICDPVAIHFNRLGYYTFTEVPMDGSRADLLAYKPAREANPDELIAIELKVRVKEMERSLEQLTNYNRVCDGSFLATTSGAVVSYLRNDPVLDKTKFQSKLEQVGAGLILVDFIGEDPKQSRCLHLTSGRRGNCQLSEQRSKIIAKCREILQTRPMIYNWGE